MKKPITSFAAARPPSKINRGQRRALMLAAALAAGLPWSSFAQPSGTASRILVGFPAGGSFDAIARLLAVKLQDELKRPVIVENKPGAGGRLAVDVLKASPADGSVVMLGPDALTGLLPFTYSKLNYDPQQDLLPVGLVAEFAFALAVNPQSPVTNVAQYVNWVKLKPENATFGIPSLGAPHHFFGLLLGDTIRVPLQPVPFQGSAPLVAALLGGHVGSSIDVAPSLVEQHRGGKLRMLAVSSPQRLPQVPDVPTFAEAGYPQITGMGFNGLYAPARTPAATVNEWNRALNKVLDSPDVRAKLDEWGFLPAPGTPAALAERGAQGAARWAPIIKASGFRAD